MTIINREKSPFLILAMLGLVAGSFFSSCVDKYEKIDKYQRPDWLDGKIYTQISLQDDMTIFSQLIADVEYDKVLDKTGTYAAFVPNDSVMELYLKNKYGSADLDNIPQADKEALVKYHILQMPWSKDQLQSLSESGWISMTDVTNNEPTAFKRKTLLRSSNKTYKIRRFLTGDDPYDIITPSGDQDRIVYNEVPKYAPLFFDGFMQATDLDSRDYEFYFGRAREGGEIYYANAKMIGEEIFAENGFVYTLDQVVEPLMNEEEILEEGDYSQFLQLIHNNPIFSKNTQATLDQDGAAEGKEVDDLYDLRYTSAGFPMNIHNEIVSTESYTVELNNGLLAPTDEAMDLFFNEYMTSWGQGWSDVPADIQRIFVKAHMAFGPIYPKDLDRGFYTANGDIVQINEDEDIQTREYASNGTFIGLKKAVTPDFFSSVSAPLFLDPNYSDFFGAYNSVDLLYAMKDPFTQFSLFLVDNSSVAADSSLFVTENGGRTHIWAYDKNLEDMVYMLNSENIGIFTRNMYGQIGVEPIMQQASKSFVETLDGRHIVVDNINRTVSGGVPSTYGFNSDSAVIVDFTETNISFPITNGLVYTCNGWLEFPIDKTYSLLEGSKFLQLLVDVGYAETTNSTLPFMDATEHYTIFAPSDAALSNYQVDTLTDAELKTFVDFHIVIGDFIFTDGRKAPGRYKTYGGDYINLNPMTDKIQILDENDAVYYDELVLSDEVNLIGMHLQDLTEEYYISNAVIHRIDTVILPY